MSETDSSKTEARFQRDDMSGPQAGSAQQARKFSPGKVTVFGAGIAGLTAAHELSERGFSVIVIEPEGETGSLQVGGLARSQVKFGVPAHFETGAVLPWTTANHAAVSGAREASSRCAQSFLFKPGSHELDDYNTAWSSAATIVRKYITLVSKQVLEWNTDAPRALPAFIRVTGFSAPSVVEAAYRATSARGSSANDDGTLISRAERRAAAVCELLQDLLIERLEREITRLCAEVNEPLPDESERERPVNETARKNRKRKRRDSWSERKDRIAALEGLRPLFKQTKPQCIRFTGQHGTDPGDCRAVAELAWEWEVLLPGEHGYRFFPSFYRHLFDTMKRTPLYQDGTETHRSTLDNLISTNSQVFSGALTSTGLTRSRPRSLEALRAELSKLLCDLGFSGRDIVAFQAKLFRYMSTSSARRSSEYENISWWDFLTYGGIEYTASFEQFIKSAPQALVAMDAETCDARTQGNIVIQLLLDQLLGPERTDSTLTGPTSDAWLDRWREHLLHQGVTFLPGKLRELRLESEPIDLLGTTQKVVPIVDLQLPGKPEHLESSNGHWTAQIEGSDYYVVATDVVTAESVSGNLAKSSPPQVLPGLPGRVGGVPVQLREFVTYVLSKTDMRIKSGGDTDWERLVRERRAVAGFPSEYWGHLRNREELPAWVQYAEEQDLRTGARRPRVHDLYIYGLTKHDRFQTFSGVQYYFAHDLEQARGHVYYFDTEWGLSSISQLQFWQNKTQFRKRGLLGLLSVDIGNFRQRSNFLGKAAHECTKEEIAHEVWRQISESVRRGRRARGEETQRLPLPRPVYYHVDDFLFPGQTIECNTFCATSAPFLVNNVGDWVNRPGSDPWDPESESIPDDLVDEPSVWQADHGGYQVHHHKVVFAGTYMRTFTRMTTMEAANESARHAVNAILDHLAEVRSVAQKDAGLIYGQWIAKKVKRYLSESGVADPKTGGADAQKAATAGRQSSQVQIEKGTINLKEIDNLVAEVHSENLLLPIPLQSIAGEHCKIWNVERYELEDLAFLKRVDEVLFAKGLPHMADILDIDGLAAKLAPLQSAPEGLVSALLGTFKKDWGIDDDAVLRGAKGASTLLQQLKDALARVTAELGKVGGPSA